MSVTTTESDLHWSPVCSVASLPKGQALGLHLHGHAVAVFRTCDGEVFALADHDGRLSAGRLTSRRDVPVVAVSSGERFELARGVCVDGGAAVMPFPVRITDGAVEVAVPAA